MASQWRLRRAATGEIEKFNDKNSHHPVVAKRDHYSLRNCGQPDHCDWHCNGDGPYWFRSLWRVLLTFLLNPVIMKLQQRGIGRMPAVMLGVSAAGLMMLLIGSLVARQVTILVRNCLRIRQNIKAKIQTLRQFGSSPMAAQFEKMAEEISEATTLPSAERATPQGEIRASESPDKAGASGPVIVRTESTPWLGLTGYLSSAFEVLATLAFSLILLVVFLIGRDDLRDRVVVLAGRARIAMTSKALEDVTDRISRYLLMVAMLNGGFGILLGLGLFALQVPYAFLWGFLAGSLRFIPVHWPVDWGDRADRHCPGDV